MALPFDATLKELVRSYPQDWLTILGRPGEARMITPDLSTISSFADLVFERDDRLIHLEAQTGPDPELSRRIFCYNALLHQRFGLPVESFVLLLRRRADRGDLDGHIRYNDVEGRSIVDFRFEVIRVWQRPYTDFLGGGVGMVPLAFLGVLPANEDEGTAMQEVVDQMTQRITEEVSRPEADRLLTASYLLSGLRVPAEIASHLFRGVKAVRDSSTYQAILQEGWTKGEAKGRAKEACRILLQQGRIRFGEPAFGVEATLTAINDIQRLEALTSRILTATSWEDLLASSS